MTSAATAAAPTPGGRRRRARRRSSYLVLALFLGLFGALYATAAPTGQAADDPAASEALIAQGRAIYLTGCSSCHGLQAQGSTVAPSLIGAGAASVDFQVSTGRMPLQRIGPQADRKRPKYTQAEINAMAAYVASLAPGPGIPSADMLDVSKGDSAKGGELFRTNCAQCHNFNGSGGALTEGKYAPSLYPATKTQIYEAMLTGPAQMPVFGDSQLSPEEKRDIITFIEKTHNQADPGGLGIGRLGPVPEGVVAWVVGTGVLILATVWIGARV